MPTDVRVPTTGNAGEDAVLVEWVVREGAEVAAGDVLVVLETAKSSVEVDAPVSGRLVRTLFAEGDEVPEHEVLAIIAGDGEVESDVAGPVASADDPGATAPALPSPAVAHEPLSTGSAPGDRPAGPVSARERYAASPRARTLAARRGLDLSELRGSGPGGRIIIADVLAVPEAPRTPAPMRAAPVPAPQQPLASSTAAGPPVTAAAPADGAPSRLHSTLDVRGARKVTAQRMTASLQHSAQVTLTRYAVADALLAFNHRLKDVTAARGLERIGVNDLLLLATARTLADHPEANSWFEGDRIRRFASVDLGFAVDTGQALLVPVVRDADTLPLGQLATAAREAISRARTGRLTAAEMQGGSVTVSNLGGLGVHFFTPVLNPPQSCIVGIGAVHQVPGQPALLPLSLTFDHRALDGAAAAAVLADLARAVEAIDVLAVL